MEHAIGVASPPALTHVEYFYGFIGVALCWQLAFLLISTNPQRFRDFMPLAVLEKLSYGIAALLLYADHRIVPATLAFACIDLLWAAGFLVAYVRTQKQDAQASGRAAAFAAH